jgi:hypothetical protein
MKPHARVRERVDTSVLGDIVVAPPLSPYAALASSPYAALASSPWAAVDVEPVRPRRLPPAD